MTTPYLDEAERCNRVAMMNDGKILLTDTPANLKKVMKGDIVELVCSNIRQSFILLKKSPLVREVQAFGDRLNIVVENAEKAKTSVVDFLHAHSIDVVEWRHVKPSLENVFISLLTEPELTQR